MPAGDTAWDTNGVTRSVAKLALATLCCGGACSGCALAPHAGPTGGTVMEDTMGYLAREWPLRGQSGGMGQSGEYATCPTGPAMAPHHNGAGHSFEHSCEQGLGQGATPLVVGATDDHAPLMRREPAVYESGGPPGRFFPAPTTPPFQSAGPSGPAAGLAPFVSTPRVPATL